MERDGVVEWNGVVVYKTERDSPSGKPILVQTKGRMS